jgi:CBS domain-containing protein
VPTISDPSACVDPAGDALRFLSSYPPFSDLPEREVADVAAAAELERSAAGTTIFSQGEHPVQFLRVVRSGAVEIVSDGRVLDLLGVGEMFGHASMLSGFPPGFEARAAEAAVCYRIPAELAHALLAVPEGLRFVARSLLEPPTDLHQIARQPASNLADQPVGTLLRGAPVIRGPDTSIREAAEAMNEGQATAVVVDLGSRGYGIVTDRDLRTKVIAAGLTGDVPVSAAMSAPAFTCSADRPAGDVLLDMLDRGIRHFPVLSPAGSVLGVVEDMDLVAVRTRSSFYLRQRISAARSISELAMVARELRPMVGALHEARVAAANVMAVYSVTVDALTRRTLELELERTMPNGPPVEFAWLALGSQARREALPSSDVDSAIVWFGGRERAQLRESLVGLSTAVLAGLQRCGLRRDEHGATATDPLFVRSLESWQRLARSWISEPTQEQALILSSVLVDSRPVWGVHTGTPVSDMFRLAPSSPALLRLLANFALSHRTPTGFLRGLVVEHTGDHRGRLDLKHGGIVPIVDLARWAGMAAGVTIASTTERLRVAGEAGTLSSADAHTLSDAFGLISNLRFEHQVGQLRAGEEPDDHVDPAQLSALMRTHLKDAFRAVTSVQKRLGTELRLGRADATVGAP